MIELKIKDVELHPLPRTKNRINILQVINVDIPCQYGMEMIDYV